MKYHTDDINIAGESEVVSPQTLLSDLALTDSMSETVFQTRKDITRILQGELQKLIVVTGPCSIHDPESALEYCQLLAESLPEFEDTLCLVMRVYFEKPRTTTGWKGLINDPHLDDTCRINEGLRIARDILCKVADKGIGAGTEYLDPITPQFLGDLISWGAIGARTVESQIHRQLASGLSCPVGFKNSTDGNIKVAVDAIVSAQNSHYFMSVNKNGGVGIFNTTGNANGHVILRGGSKETNFEQSHVKETEDLLNKAGLPANIMIDASHANSLKKHKNQIKVCKDIAKQIDEGNKSIKGVMIESHLKEGNQKLARLEDLTYGQSITDACINWDDTLDCLRQLADAQRKRQVNASWVERG